MGDKAANYMYLYASRSKFYTDGGLGFQVELIACEAREEVTFTHTRIANQHN